MGPVLNLNNEVVKMRKDVKKVRVLTIRRLTRHIGKLKLKKGSEDLKLKNQKRVERLIEEIHAMKTNSAVLMCGSQALISGDAKSFETDCVSRK